MNEDIQTAVDGVARMLLMQRLQKNWPETWAKFVEEFEAAKLPSFKVAEADVTEMMYEIGDDYALVLYPPAKGYEDYL